jgi:sirohydrochlorin ferrochelatase
MKALLLVAHGSRRAASNTEVLELAATMAGEVADSFAVVEAAFLELAEPDIPTGVRLCAERGAQSVTVVPYFLAAGTHVVNDIPSIIEALRADFPALEFRVARHIGASELMPGLIRQCAVQ